MYNSWSSKIMCQISVQTIWVYLLSHHTNWYSCSSCLTLLFLSVQGKPHIHSDHEHVHMTSLLFSSCSTCICSSLSAISVRQLLTQNAYIGCLLVLPFHDDTLWKIWYMLFRESYYFYILCLSLGNGCASQHIWCMFQARINWGELRQEGHLV